MIMLVLFAATPVYATMPVNDPLANKTLLAMWGKITAMAAKINQMYTVAKGHFDSAVEVEELLSEAHSTYETVINLDVNEIAESFKTGGELDDVGPFGQLGAIQQGVEDKVSTGEDTVDFAAAKMNRIKNIERLSKLKAASFKNMGKASKNLKERDSDQITAQSTSTLAALEALKQQEKEQERLANGKIKKEEEKETLGMGNVYGAMGKKRL